MRECVKRRLRFVLESDCISVPGHGQKGSRVKRPILGLLAAAILSLGLLGSSPVQAATTYSPAASTMTPAHDNGDDHPRKHSARSRQGGSRFHDHDDDDDDGNGHHGNGHRGRRRCSGLIVIFCS